MVGAGHHFALNRDNAKRVFAAPDDQTVLTLANELRSSKEMVKNGQVIDCKKFWDPIHRCLTEGTLDPEGGEIPLNHVVLGGKQIAKGNDYFISVVRPDLTPFVAEALHDIKEPEFRQRYFKLADHGYEPALNEKEYALVWHQVQELRVFFEYCSEERFAVLFVGKKQP